MKNRLKVCRAERNWTQADLAERAGVARQTINVIEKGHYDPSLALAFKLARILGVDLEELFQPDDEDVRDESASSATASSTMRDSSARP